MEFKEALEAAQKGKLISTGSNDRWAKKVGDYWHDEKGNQINWIPEVYVSDTWQIKPEEIYVWGVCDGIGTSLLFQSKPSKNPDWGADGGVIVLSQNNDLFSSDKPQKYKLVLMET